MHVDLEKIGIVLFNEKTNKLQGVKDYLQGRVDYHLGEIWTRDDMYI